MGVGESRGVREGSGDGEGSIQVDLALWEQPRYKCTTEKFEASVSFVIEYCCNNSILSVIVVTLLLQLIFKSNFILVMFREKQSS